MPDRDSYPDGAPCWVDALCPDPQAGAKFYGEIFGWEFQDMGEEFGHYMMASKNGKLVAAITAPMSDDTGAPPAWSVYLRTSDAAATAEKIKAAGGAVMVEPMEVPGSGHMVMGVDPGGAVFGAWQ